MIESMIKIWAKYDYVFINGLFGTLWLAVVTVLRRQVQRFSEGSR